MRVVDDANDYRVEPSAPAGNDSPSGVPGGRLDGRPTEAAAERSAGSPIPFESLEAPEPLVSQPSAPARWLAFASTVLAGLLGGVAGYGIGDLLGGSAGWAAVGGFIGGVSGALGVGIVANLTLRAMNEWDAVQHPEAGSASRTKKTKAVGGADRDGLSGSDDEPGGTDPGETNGVDRGH